MIGTLKISAAALLAACAVTVRAAGPEPAVQAADSVASRHGAHLVFEEESHDFGDVQRRGGDLHHSFAFRNDGDSPLVIAGMETTCTCLKYDYPKRPVAPGDRGRIEITYEPHKVEAGSFHRVILVYSNSADGRRMLFIEGNSLEKERR